MSDHIRVGLVGAGSRGRKHVSALQKIRSRNELYSSGYQTRFERYAPELPPWYTDVSDLAPELTAIFDPSEESREHTLDTCADGGDIPDEFSTFEGFRSEGDFDAVVIATPNDTHVEYVAPLLDDDYAVLCEKPLATTLPAHDELIEHAAATDGLFYPAFNLRASPYYRRLKELLQRGVVGSLGMITCHQVRQPFPPGFRYSNERTGGALLEKNCHDFDVFNWFIESDPKRVSSFGNQQFLTENNDIVDQATVIVEYETGELATLELCLYSPFGSRGRRYEIRGWDGILRSGEKKQSIELHKRLNRDEYSSKTVDLPGHKGADVAQMERFLRSVQGTKEPPATATDAKKAAAIAIAADAAIKSGRVVEIDDAYDLVLPGGDVAATGDP